MSQTPTNPNPKIETSLYETDFYAWTQQQAKLLSEGRWHQLDVTNLIEEIESLGKRERQQLRNRLGVLLGHLLKWQFQPDYRSKSWIATLREQRRRLTILLEENPSWQPYLSETFALSYALGADLGVRETPLDYGDFPETCPYTWEQAIDPEFLPE
ncbi:MAG TPA: DUF29 domain-containing protein [Oscillatoriales cyanobacterium M59_W2019_021]|nr:MAG: DUF29 domain-containing protein [Cyanobacteria bacterium J055]HIK31511.1 DUF29 domain-containing protein [Oscillatoriales cyanobacterium M4454_W2019_049]HIK53332.1 DUF29 domain-containing protein [Oscillatoriales cyanobacterium M59_W2019_021]